MHKNIARAAAVVALSGGIIAPAVDAATEAPKTCEAHIVVFEDGSWMGTDIFSAKGTHIASRWDVQGPQSQNTVTEGAYHSAWPVEQNGQQCTVIVD